MVTAGGGIHRGHYRTKLGRAFVVSLSLAASEMHFCFFGATKLEERLVVADIWGGQSHDFAARLGSTELSL